MPTLLAIRGPLTGARITLSDDNLQIGRASNLGLTLADATVSRTHAVIRKQGLAWLIEDRESSTGTIVNGAKIKGVMALAPNDEIKIGHSIFLFDSQFDLQNADFTDNVVYVSSGNEDTMKVAPVATLDARHIESRDTRETPRQGVELLADVGDLFDSSKVPFGEALRFTMERLSKLLHSDSALLLLYDHGAGQLRPSVAIAPGNVLVDQALVKKVFKDRKAILISDKPEPIDHPAPGAPALPKVRSIIAAPIIIDDNCLGLLSFERQELDAYSLKDLRIVQSLGKLLGVFIETRQRAEALNLKANYHGSGSPVIGQSARFKKTLDMCRRVADTSATILLVGETGTGKEVMASEIHRVSPRGRNNRPFIAVNCAAIPENLFESELFGHEKGSFTGAHRLRQGYIEQAQGGTLLLDEIGELSLSLQPKLLRFLQEHTFTRVGGNRLLRAEVRVIAATNRDLMGEVKAGRFREDLYHRLSVMPIEIPPLRERREDIRLLAEHYIREFATKFGKEVIGISDDALIALEKYEWPGNIRELANCMERALLLSDDKVLLPRHFNLPKGSSIGAKGAKETSSSGVRLLNSAAVSAGFRPLEEIEKEYILKVLLAVGDNQVRAADVLGIHRNTLRKKLQDWGLVTG